MIGPKIKLPAARMIVLSDIVRLTRIVSTPKNIPISVDSGYKSSVSMVQGMSQGTALKELIAVFFHG